MLTRLTISGFKNLVDVDVYFGPFTCIAGVNGVGKSNLFDAIRFLSATADRTLLEAARSVRDERGRSADVRSLFHHFGNTYAPEIRFTAEMIIPFRGVDDLGQSAEASITFLKYELRLKYTKGTNHGTSDGLELAYEGLEHINLGDATQQLLFDPKPTWRKSALRGRRTSPFISTDDSNRIIRRHQDGRSGRTLDHAAANLPRTVLSAANAAESPTALLARRELQSWRLLQLEPSALRQPDEFTAPVQMGANGSHLASTLYHLAKANNGSARGAESDVSQVACYAQVANQLSQLVEDVRRVSIDRDEKRELLTLLVTDADGTTHAARALSDGTLRFLALTVLQLDTNAAGVVCLEEPENGIHPDRIPAMLRLIQDICTDVQEPIGPDNPLRQVIVNTHSPSVILQVPDDSVLLAEQREFAKSGTIARGLAFSCLPNTWRAKAQAPKSTRIVPKGRLLAYLNPVTPEPASDDPRMAPTTARRRSHHTRRVIDNPDIQPYLFPSVNKTQ